MKEMGFNPWVRNEDPTCCGAAKPVRHNERSCTTQPTSCNSDLTQPHKYIYLKIILKKNKQFLRPSLLWVAQERGEATQVCSTSELASCWDTGLVQATPSPARPRCDRSSLVPPLVPTMEEVLQEHWVKTKKAYPFILSGSGWSAHLADEETEAHQGKAICLRLTLLTDRAGIWTGLARSDTLALPFTTSHALGIES